MGLRLQLEYLAQLLATAGIEVPLQEALAEARAAKGAEEPEQAGAYIGSLEPPRGRPSAIDGPARRSQAALPPPTGQACSASATKMIVQVGQVCTSQAHARTAARGLLVLVSARCCQITLLSASCAMRRDFLGDGS